jgi:hypothetical protein
MVVSSGTYDDVMRSPASAAGQHLRGSGVRSDPRPGDEPFWICSASRYERDLDDTPPEQFRI